MNEEQITSKLREVSERKNASLIAFVDRVVTVSTGFLAFSITFRSSIVGSGAGHIWLLKLSWLALTVATICGVFLHRATASAAQDMIVRIQYDYRVKTGVGHPIYPLLYTALCWAFPIGIAAVMLFGISNLP